jgi:hypothetical protein
MFTGKVFYNLRHSTRLFCLVIFKMWSHFMLAYPGLQSSYLCFFMYLGWQVHTNHTKPLVEKGTPECFAWADLKL